MNAWLSETFVNSFFCQRTTWLFPESYLFSANRTVAHSNLVTQAKIVNLILWMWRVSETCDNADKFTKTTHHTEKHLKRLKVNKTYSVTSTRVLFSSNQTSACMCLYISGTLWWGRWPSPVQTGAKSLRAPQRRSTTCSLEFLRWSPCLWTVCQPRGGQRSVRRVPRPPWRGECYCGWAQTDSTLGGCVRAECTGREDCPSTETSPTNWRERSPVSSSTRRTTSQVRQQKRAATNDSFNLKSCFWLSMIYKSMKCQNVVKNAVTIS